MTASRPIAMIPKSVQDIYARIKLVTRRPWHGVNRYGQAGGLLWVREKALVVYVWPFGDAKAMVHYANDQLSELAIPIQYIGKTGLKPGRVLARYMPKWMARLWLYVEDISLVKRRQMNTADANREGYATPARFHEAWRDIYGGTWREQSVQRIQFHIATEAEKAGEA